MQTPDDNDKQAFARQGFGFKKPYFCRPRRATHAKLTLPIGEQNFRKIREEDMLYVDKTELS
ncbi:MAG: hypothetical protein L6Q97_05900 [Thermoanaerobaculia bacterium]|nr:hypothetical protein [Thermoanaerobaculia bacterium]